MLNLRSFILISTVAVSGVSLGGEYANPQQAFEGRAIALRDAYNSGKLNKGHCNSTVNTGKHVTKKQMEGIKRELSFTRDWNRYASEVQACENLGVKYLDTIIECLVPTLDTKCGSEGMPKKGRSGWIISGPVEGFQEAVGQIKKAYTENNYNDLKGACTAIKILAEGLKKSEMDEYKAYGEHSDWADANLSRKGTGVISKCRWDHGETGIHIAYQCNVDYDLTCSGGGGLKFSQ